MSAFASIDGSADTQVSGVNVETERRIEAVFAGRGASFRLFRVVRDFIDSIGPVRIVPGKTQVGFSRARRFAWVWLPQMWIKKQPAESITLTLSLDHRVKDPRIKESVEPYPGRFTHHLVITEASEFDPKIRRWLREAYALAGSSRGGRTRARKAG